MTQWEKRVKLFQYIYSCLITDASEEEILNKHLNEAYEFDIYWLKVIEYIAFHYNEIVELITSNIAKTWTYDRLSYTDKAIMFCAIGEYRTHNIDKAIIIDQSLITAKNHHIDDSYKYINAILEKIL